MNEDRVRQIIRDELMRNKQQARFNLNVNPNVRHTGIDAFPVNAGNLAPGLRTSGSVKMTSVKNYTFNTNFRPSLVTFYGNPYRQSGGAILTLSISAAGAGYHLGDTLNINGGINGTATINQLDNNGGLLTITLKNGGFDYGTGITTVTSASGYGQNATVSINSVSPPSTDRHTFVFGQAALGQNLAFQPNTSNSVKTGGTLEIVQTSTMFMALGSGINTTFQAIAGQEHLVNVQESGSVVARATVNSYGPSSFTISVDTLASGWVISGNYFVS